MSEAKPKRRFWQFHLSTAITMMLLVGVFIEENVKIRKVNLPPSDIQELEKSGLQLFLPGIKDVVEQLHENVYGWPLAFGNSGQTYDGPSEIDKKVGSALRKISLQTTDSELTINWYNLGYDFDTDSTTTARLTGPRPWKVSYFLVDCFSCVSVVLITAIASEWLIRRREARKT